MSTQQAQPRQKLADARRALYRTTIVDAAERVFAEHGYESAKVAVIAKAAGVSLATLYSTFPKKSDVYRALQEDRLGTLMQTVGTAVLAATDPFERLRAGIEGYLAFHMAHPDYLRGQLRERVPWGTTDELRTPEQTRAWEAGLAMMTAAFSEGIAAGLFVDEDPQLCARMATAMSQVRLALWIDATHKRDPKAVTRAALEQFVRTFADPSHVVALIARLDDPV